MVKKIITAKHRGFCAGVERAVEMVEKSLLKYGAPVYVRHEIVHNKFVVNNLREKGVVYVDSIEEIPDPSNKDHVAAPIPGLLVDVAVTEGIKEPKGAKLCTIEAMKMETVIYADQP